VMREGRSAATDEGTVEGMVVRRNGGREDTARSCHPPRIAAPQLGPGDCGPASC
jgi:hypothetical protein